MQTRKFLTRCSPVVLAVTLAGLGCGCDTVESYSLTHKLWDTGTRSYCEPLANPELALFEAKSKDDVLVQYSAISDRHDRVLRFAYFLGANQARILAGKQPHFVRLKPADDWPAIPINGQPAPAARLISTNIHADASGKFFTLYRQDQAPESYPLPDYMDDYAGWMRAALTPFAITGDALMVGSVVGFVAGYVYLQGNGPNNYGH